MNVLALAHTAVLGGASRSLSLVIGQLTAARCRVTVLAPAGPALTGWEAAGAEVLEWAPPSSTWLGVSLFSIFTAEPGMDRLLNNLVEVARLPLRVAPAARRVEEVVVERGIHTIYVNSVPLFPLGARLANLRRRHRTRVIWQLREPLSDELPEWLSTRIVSAVGQASDRILAISAVEAKSFQGAGEIEVLHNSVAAGWEALSPPLQPPTTVRIAMSGASRPSKGREDYFEMARLLASRHPGAEFLFYCPHPVPARHRGIVSAARGLVRAASEKLAFAQEILEDMRECTLQHGIRMVFDRGLDLDAYRELTVYVRADRSGSPWGRDVIEAMWAGVPIVATGTSQEFIRDGETGFLVPPRRPDLLAERVAALLADADLRARFARTSHQRARELFAPSRYGERLRRAFGLDSLASGGVTAP